MLLYLLYFRCQRRAIRELSEKAPQPDPATKRYKEILTRKLARAKLFYRALIKNVKESFERRMVSLKSVIEVTKCCRDERYHDHPELSQAALNKMRSMDEVWDAFSRRTSWYNSEMVEGVVMLLGDKDDQKHLQEYREKQTSLLHHLNNAERSKEAKIILKLDEEFKHFTNEMMGQVRLAICDLLDCQACALDKEEGCVKITLFIPAEVVEDAFPLSPSMRDTFKKAFPTMISITYRKMTEKFEVILHLQVFAVYITFLSCVLYTVENGC